MSFNFLDPQFGVGLAHRTLKTMTVQSLLTQYKVSAADAFSGGCQAAQHGRYTAPVVIIAQRVQVTLLQSHMGVSKKNRSNSDMDPT